MTSKEAVLELICEAKSVNRDEGRVCFLRKIIEKDLDRLEELEDLEEELGIDLITLFKALENGVWYKDYKDDDKIKFTDRVEENIGCKEFTVPAKYTTIGLKFKDYGETWALTKKELDNE